MPDSQQHELKLIATAAAGTESIVKRELASLGYEARVTTPGRLLFEAPASAIARANLWLRSGERVLIEMGRFAATDFGVLFDATASLPWERWLTRDAAFPVSGRSHHSQLSSVPACQKIVKRAIVERLRKSHKVQLLPETGPLYAVEVSLRDDLATLTLDTTGVGLHKRGYRRLVGEAQLRETLAAVLVQLSYWRPGRVLVDPFCGTGTVPIEAALLGRNIAPGLNRSFVAEAWPTLPAPLWREAREEARDRMLPPLAERLIGYDIDPEALSLARFHAEQAGVANDIHWQQRPFTELRAKAEFGCLITNPPYGERLNTDSEVEELYRSFPLVLRRLPTWSHYILSSRHDLETLVGQPANRRRKLYNGALECTYYQFHGPRPSPASALPPKEGQGGHFAESHVLCGAGQGESSREPLFPTTATEEGQGEGTNVLPLPTTSTASAKASPQQPVLGPAFGGLQSSAARQAEEFANRLKNRARHLRRWPTKRGIRCYRLYDRDVPDVPLIVDCYEDALHIAEFARPHDRTPAQHADWLDAMVRTAAKVLEIPRDRVFVKHRDRQRGTDQYERIDDRAARFVVHEGGLKFVVNLSDYIDTGLFLDHRITREMVRQAAKGTRMLNLFAYTGAFSVYAAAGGAVSTTSVDKSATYTAWARENLELNGFSGPAHRIVQSDLREFMARLSPGEVWDLAVVDPPTFSNTKGYEDDWDIQRDHGELLRQLAKHLSPNAVVFFSTNSRRFHLNEAALGDYVVRNITRQTIPEDFRNERIHQCWKLIRMDSSRSEREMKG
ncbi:MAG: bifunctional 23S rRNA (guanine(2069)-N(7))-methyltransferase RlmK/23S rRNA (guanine(2445)-N(2))-methyltransferase RlmL [Pirellulales bacterium]|nr:bifunctional 23S rRNA (guanine(2069)-N(7))-methyltransferase RlmK/23S rRNA (guanine(2445)-N(2))-methyltransferase RlmL [Pirellulales bacterium]